MADGKGPAKTTSAVKAALAARELHTRTEEMQLLESEPVAIIGMGCRLPGGIETLTQFWDLLSSGGDAITPVPPERWDRDAVYDPDTSVPGKINTQSGGFVEHVDEFDPVAFGIAPQEAPYIDPQHRMLLEVAWEACEDGGYSLDTLRGSHTGVFFSLYNADYRRMLHQNAEAIGAHTLSGTSPSIASGRLSYLYDLRGPSMIVDTACSSSLVAIHLAMHSLRRRESDLAVAGGVSVNLAPEETMSLTKWGMLSPDGRCKTFDESANGFVRSEGCGVVALKRLSDALRDGDRVHAVIRGSAVNQDGRSNVLTAPNGEAQRDVIRSALANAGIAASSVSYVETHGTGTKVGDPIELDSLSDVLGATGDGDLSCHLGSVKANIGHLEAAAGVASIIKTALCFQHGQIPPQVHFRKLNPLASLDGTRLRIPTALTDWDPRQGSRIAGVSSFGFSGTNAHIVLEEPPALPARKADRQRAQLLPLSAKNKQALAGTIASYRHFLAADEERRPADIAYSAAARRSHHPYRAAFVGTTTADLSTQLDAPRPEAARIGKAPKIGFVFSGQGTGWAGMARGLLRDEPLFESLIARCDSELDGIVDWRIADTLNDETDDSWLDDTERYQVILFATEVGLAELWQSWGIRPTAVVGHSIGEISGALVAGVIDLGTALRLVARRAILMNREADDGAMAVVGLGLEDAEEALKQWSGKLVVAAHNGRNSVTISGEPQALDEFLQQPQIAEGFHRKLVVTRAFHSPYMQAAASQLEQEFAQLEPQAEQTTIYSTVTGGRIDGKSLGSGYWCRNVRERVSFIEAIDSMLGDDIDCFIEIGPHPGLLPGIAAAAGNPDVVVLGSLRRDQDDRTSMLENLGRLYERGADIDWDAVTDAGSRLESLPAYSWQRASYWAPEAALAAGASAKAGADELHTLLGRRIDSPFVDDIIYETSLSIDSPAWLQDHFLSERCIVPAAALIDMSLTASCAMLGVEHGIELRDGAHYRPLLLGEGESARVQVAFRKQTEDNWRLRIVSRPDGGDESPADAEWATNFECTLLRHDVAPRAHISPSSRISELDKKIDVDRVRAQLGERRIILGPTFRGLSQLSVQGDESVWQINKVRLPEDGRGYVLYPPHLDACFQSLEPFFAGDGTWLPLGFTSVRLHRRPQRIAWGSSNLQQNPQTSTTGQLLSDMTLYDESEQACVEIDAFRCTPVGAPALQKLLTSQEPDLLHEIRWETASVGGEEARGGSWLIFADSHGIGEQLAGQLQARDARCVLVQRGAAFSSPAPDRYLADPGSADDLQRLFAEPAAGISQYDNVVFLWGLDQEPAASLSIEATHGLSQAALNLSKALAGAPASNVWLITRGAQLSTDTTGMTQAPLWGLGAVLDHELPWQHIRLLDLDPRDADATAVAALAAEFAYRGTAENRIAWSDGKRQIARLHSGSSAESGTGLRDDATYLITGATGGIGKSLISSLVQRGARHLALLARSSTPATEQLCQELRAQNVNAQVFTADVSDRESLQAAISAIQQQMPALKGVFHLAGVIDDGPIVTQTWDRFEGVYRPKVQGSWNLHELTGNCELDLFVLYSSAASVFGWPGQAAYAGGNAFLDALARYRQGLGLPARSVNWGPWSDAGMATATTDEKGVDFAKRGMKPLTPAEADAAMTALLAPGAAQSVAAWFDPDRLPASSLILPMRADRPQPAAAASTPAPATPAAAGTTAKVAGADLTQIRETLKRETAQVLGLQPGFEIDEHQPLNELGLDSLLAMQLANALGAAFSAQMPATLLFDYPTIEALAEYVAANTSGATAATEMPAAPAAASATPAAPSVKSNVADFKDFARPASPAAAATQGGRSSADIRETLKRETAQVLGLQPGFEIDEAQPLNELGLDSLLAMQLANALGTAFSIQMPPTLLFDYPTIEALTEYVAANVQPAAAEASAPAAAVNPAVQEMRHAQSNVTEFSNFARPAVTRPAPPPAAPAVAPAAPVAGESAPATATDIRSILMRETAQVLGLQPGFEIEEAQPLNELGLDSLLAMQLANALGTAFSIHMPPTLLFDYPTIEALSGYITETVGTRPVGQAQAPIETQSVVNEILGAESAEMDLDLELEPAPAPTTAPTASAPATRSPGDNVRPFRSDDIEQVADLYYEVFGMGSGPAPDELRAYFNKIYFNNPWVDLDVDSWVHIAANGNIDGFVGHFPRPMHFEGRPVRVAMGSTMMVAEEARGSGVVAELFRCAFSSDVDLVMVDGANDDVRRLWSANGGDVSLLYSCNWLKMLRPATGLMDRLGERRLVGGIARALKPGARLFDSLLTRVPSASLRIPKPASAGTPMTPDKLVEHLIGTHDSCALTPVYDKTSIDWLLDDMQEAMSRGQIKMIEIAGAAGKAPGWCVYFSKPGSMNQVINMGGPVEVIPDVLNDLFRRSWQEGAVAVTGRFDPRFAKEFSDARCSFSFSDLGVVTYTRDAGIRNALHRGDTSLSRLDGEWWMHFADGPWSQRR